MSERKEPDEDRIVTRAEATTIAVVMNSDSQDSEIQLNGSIIGKFRYFADLGIAFAKQVDEANRLKEIIEDCAMYLETRNEDDIKELKSGRFKEVADIFRSKVIDPNI